MKPPSKFWLYLSVVATLFITLIGLIFTFTSYKSAQRQAETVGLRQLETVNQAAIKLISRSIESYHMALANYADDHLEGAALADLQRPLTLPVINSANNAMVGLFLIDQQGQVIAQNTATAVNKPEDPPVQELLFKDPSLDKVLAGRQVQNGQVYFDGKQAYLNVYQSLTLDDKEAVLVMPLNLQRMYHHEFTTDRNVSGYTMVKNADMRIVMHPSDEQIGFSIVESRKKEFPELDFTDLERLEQEQIDNEAGTSVYYSYWWNEETLQKVLKLAAYQWITIGDSRLIVASNADFLEQSGLFLQDNLILIGLLGLLFVIMILLTVLIKNYMKRNQAYVENQALKERQRLLKEKHEIEKNILQESKLETIGLLTTSIVHDLNNFLTPMIGHLQLLIEENQHDEVLMEDLQEVCKAAEKGKELSSNVLRFSKLESADKTVQSIAATLTEAIDTMRALLSKAFSLTYDIQEVGYAVYEKIDLQVIIYNLLMNVYQANADCSIRLSRTSTESATFPFRKQAFSAQQEFALIEISDNGPGIPEAIQEKIFTRFFTTKSATGGTGLGLFTVSSIVEKNDWLIDVTSTPKGTTFYIGIPLTDPEKATEPN
ncbi:HAMP domain-containing sensor histidine kinase [Enterococcus casseliflavus]|uniref:sensor histidine kinase n=1 Tax=Enterococcus casseliflavus TaxID=37734 RepID=UPI00232F1EF9|nr:HAMP domain-containing sensor histidine kinase [Enterococcus casseliflavus]MDB1696419.1 HAMP domain-containing sensor histidine kinase [Enterococcus casseliflavus]MDB1699486.1 HAMP domain-containing sensor histidine kinase [Enterococcus casseliflavus]MDB1701711.1 HAMP domain-containing sensor histidine kinase [Enterococcus casseliflavus]MDB1706585.1 HAMP domain-containing sensor histidine kinase [Enterococcus casseliflavus]